MATAVEVASTWQRAEIGPLYAIQDGGSLYLDPYCSDRGNVISSVVRIFVSPDEAQEYYKQLIGYGAISAENSQVISLTLDEVFSSRNSLYEISKREFDCKFRMEFSTCSPEDYPSPVDVLWDFSRRLH